MKKANYTEIEQIVKGIYDSSCVGIGQATDLYAAFTTQYKADCTRYTNINDAAICKTINTAAKAFNLLPLDEDDELYDVYNTALGAAVDYIAKELGDNIPGGMKASNRALWDMIIKVADIIKD